MNNYFTLLRRNGLEVNKVTIRGKAIIVSTPLGQFVIKKNKNIEIYEYLLSRGFNYFPKIIDYDNDYILFEYINNIKYEEEERAKDFIKVLSLLHLKTSFVKEVNIDDIKLEYEKIHNKIDDTYNYYNNLINIIESKEYMSPIEYLVGRNISIIFSAINYCKNELNNYYDLIKSSNKKRVVTLYNNVDINNLLKSIDNSFLCDLDNTTVNSSIYDLYNFYIKYYNTYNFPYLLSLYEKVYKLSKEEKMLLYILISIPNKIEITNNVHDIKCVKNEIDKIYITLEVLNSEKEKSTETKENEDNK